ncbi:hypothetical protein ABEB36_000520 [Hypothenemus hampei]|uniref:Fibronectin type-III domain-containing protein n=1 Tax=Hypothenemus hampei TaxID=57062 RepID=A0ABD1FCB5_HYPHA
MDSMENSCPCSSDINDPTEYLETLKKKYMLRTAKLQAQQQELERKIIKMESMIDKHEVKSLQSCPCDNNNASTTPKVFSETPVHDIEQPPVVQQCSFFQKMMENAKSILSIKCQCSSSSDTKDTSATPRTNTPITDPTSSEVPTRDNDHSIQENVVNYEETLTDKSSRTSTCTCDLSDSSTLHDVSCSCNMMESEPKVEARSQQVSVDPSSQNSSPKSQEQQLDSKPTTDSKSDKCAWNTISSELTSEGCSCEMCQCNSSFSSLGNEESDDKPILPSVSVFSDKKIAPDAQVQAVASVNNKSLQITKDTVSKCVTCCKNNSCLHKAGKGAGVQVSKTMKNRGVNIQLSQNTPKKNLPSYDKQTCLTIQQKSNVCKAACNTSYPDLGKTIAPGTNRQDNENQCAFIGSPLLSPNTPITDKKSSGKTSFDNTIKGSQNPCSCSGYSLTSNDINEIQNISDLVKKEKEMKVQIAELQKREKQYRKASKNIETLTNKVQSPCCCCQQNSASDEIEKIGRELRLENQILKTELLNMKLELKHCLEKVEGPMKQQLQTEKFKCENLQKQLQETSKNMAMSKEAYSHEMNELKMQLCCACNNITELNQMNRRLNDEMAHLDCLCQKLEDDLLKQKVSEAETIKRLTSRKFAESTQQSESEEFKCDSNLDVIARKLSNTIKELAPCEECSKLPAELAGAAKCIKELTDMVRKRKKKSSSRGCCCKSKSSAKIEDFSEEDCCSCCGDGDKEKTVKTILQVPETYVKNNVSSKFNVTGVQSSYFSTKGESPCAKLGTPCFATKGTVMEEEYVDAISEGIPCSQIGTPCEQEKKDVKERVIQVPSGIETSCKAPCSTQAEIEDGISDKARTDGDSIADTSTHPEGEGIRDDTKRLLQEQEMIDLPESEKDDGEVNRTTEIPFEEKRFGPEFPYDVENKAFIISESPAELHVTTTTTQSGILEVITEGPEGTIGTTLTYTPEGNIEVFTEMVEQAEILPDMATDKFNISHRMPRDPTSTHDIDRKIEKFHSKIVTSSNISGPSGPETETPYTPGSSTTNGDLTSKLASSSSGIKPQFFQTPDLTSGKTEELPSDEKVKPIVVSVVEVEVVREPQVFIEPIEKSAVMVYSTQSIPMEKPIHAKEKIVFVEPSEEVERQIEEIEETVTTQESAIRSPVQESLSEGATAFEIRSGDIFTPDQVASEYETRPSEIQPPVVVALEPAVQLVKVKPSTIFPVKSEIGEQIIIVESKVEPDVVKEIPEQVADKIVPSETFSPTGELSPKISVEPTIVLEKEQATPAVDELSEKQIIIVESKVEPDVVVAIPEQVTDKIVPSETFSPTGEPSPKISVEPTIVLEKEQVTPAIDEPSEELIIVVESKVEPDVVEVISEQVSDKIVPSETFSPSGKPGPKISVESTVTLEKEQVTPAIDKPSAGKYETEGMEEKGEQVVEVPYEESTTGEVVLEATLEPATPTRMTRDCSCQSKDQSDQSCQCCECKTVGVTTSGDKETITEKQVEMDKISQETLEETKTDTDSEFMTISEATENAAKESLSPIPEKLSINIEKETTSHDLEKISSATPQEKKEESAIKIDTLREEIIQSVELIEEVPVDDEFVSKESDLEEISKEDQEAPLKDLDHKSSKDQEKESDEIVVKEKLLEKHSELKKTSLEEEKLEKQIGLKRESVDKSIENQLRIDSQVSREVAFDSMKAKERTSANVPDFRKQESILQPLVKQSQIDQETSKGVEFDSSDSKKQSSANDLKLVKEQQSIPDQPEANQQISPEVAVRPFKPQKQSSGKLSQLPVKDDSTVSKDIIKKQPELVEETSIEKTKIREDTAQQELPGKTSEIEAKSEEILVKPSEVIDESTVKVIDLQEVAPDVLQTPTSFTLKTPKEPLTTEVDDLQEKQEVAPIVIQRQISISSKTSKEPSDSKFAIPERLSRIHSGLPREISKIKPESEKILVKPSEVIGASTIEVVDLQRKHEVAPNVLQLQTSVTSKTSKETSDSKFVTPEQSSRDVSVICKAPCRSVATIHMDTPKESEKKLIGDVSSKGLQQTPSSRDDSASCKASCRSISVQSAKRLEREIKEIVAARSDTTTTSSSSSSAARVKEKDKTVPGEVPSIVSQLSDKEHPTIESTKKPRRKRRPKAIDCMKCYCPDPCNCEICTSGRKKLGRAVKSCDCPPHIKTMSPMQMTYSMPPTGHAANCSCNACLCDEPMKRSSVQHSQDRSASDAIKNHYPGCECVDCLCLPQVKKLARTKEAPVVYDKKQVYHFKVKCDTCTNANNARRYLEQQNRSRIPISTTTSNPPRVRSEQRQETAPQVAAADSVYNSIVCDCSQCACTDCPDEAKQPKQQAKAADPEQVTEGSAQCPCDPQIVEQLVQRLKNAEEKLAAVQTSVPPTAAPSEPAVTPAKPDDEEEPCDCVDCVCPGADLMPPKFNAELSKVGLSQKPDSSDSGEQPGGHPPDCSCSECSCPNINDYRSGKPIVPSPTKSPTPPGETPKPSSGAGDENCDCAVCDCPFASKLFTASPAGPAGAATILTEEFKMPSCDCQDCQCSPCADPNKQKPIPQSIESEPGIPDCDCVNCKCSPCADLKKRLTTEQDVPGKEKEKKSEEECDCSKCECTKDDEGVPETISKFTDMPEKVPHPSDCDCDECMCLEEIIQTEGVAQDDKATQPPSGHEGNCSCTECLCKECFVKSIHELGCLCGECLCNPCDKMGIRKETAAKASQLSEQQSHPGGCTCIICACDVCSNPDKQRQTPVVGVAAGDEKEHGSNCKCIECLCQECLKILEPLKHDDGCQCAQCICVDCLKKMQQGDATSQPHITEVSQPDDAEVANTGKGVPTTQSKGVMPSAAQGDHEGNCDCAECLCKPCFKKPSSPEEPCTCPECTCIDCTKKKTDQPVALQTGDKATHSPVCDCEICMCEKEEAEKEIATTKVQPQGGLSLTDPPPFEPLQRLDCQCKEKCTCIICTNERGGNQSTADVPARSLPGVAIAGHPNDYVPPPFEAPVRQECFCQKCSCIYCNKQAPFEKKNIASAKSLPNGNGTSPSGHPIDQVPPAFEPPMRIDCICNKCSCINCNKQAPAQRSVAAQPSIAQMQGTKIKTTVSIQQPPAEVLAAQSKILEAQSTILASSKIHPIGCLCSICKCDPCKQDPNGSINAGVSQGAIVNQSAVISQTIAEHGPGCICPVCICLSCEMTSSVAPESSIAAKTSQLRAAPSTMAEPVHCDCPTCTCTEGGLIKSSILERSAEPVPNVAFDISDPTHSVVIEVGPSIVLKEQSSVIRTADQLLSADTLILPKPDIRQMYPDKPKDCNCSPPCKCNPCQDPKISGIVDPNQIIKPMDASKQLLTVDTLILPNPDITQVVTDPDKPKDCDCLPPCKCQVCQDPKISKIAGPSETVKSMDATKQLLTADALILPKPAITQVDPDKPKDCDCPPPCRCQPCQDPKISKIVGPSETVKSMDNVALVKSIQAANKENCECREQIEEIKRTLEKIKIACHEAEFRSVQNMAQSMGKDITSGLVIGKPFVKQATAFGQTMSGLKMALNNLQAKCKAKDRMIEAMTAELNQRESPDLLNRIMNVSATLPHALDYDPADDVKSLSRSQGEGLTTQVLYGPTEVKDDATAVTSLRCVASKGVEVRTHKHKRKKTSGRKDDCICDNPQIVQTQERHCQKLDLAGFEVVDIRRITDDSLIVKWNAPNNDQVQGYDIYVNGTVATKVMSGSRTSAMMHSLDLSKSVQITIYAVTKCGRVEPPAIAIYEIKS